MKRLVVIILTLSLAVGVVDVSAQGNLLKRIGKAIGDEIVTGVRQGVKKGIKDLQEQGEHSATQTEKRQTQEQREQPQERSESDSSYAQTNQSSANQSQVKSSSKSKRSTAKGQSGSRQLFVAAQLPQVSPSEMSGYDPNLPVTGKHLGHEWVDLGLPSGVCWSKTNFGSVRAESVGYHLAWASSSREAEYSREQYNQDGLLLGDISGNVKYDAVRGSWGRGWRLPSIENFAELVNNCDREYVELKGVYGVRFVSRVNGQSIFLPLTGYRYGWEHNSKEEGMYWLSTPNDDGNSAYMFKLTSSADELYFAERYLGLCLRPVMDRLPEEKRVTKGQVAGHDWVDLALPSGTRWATCNIDAAKPSQPGKHYAWGETVVKSSYTEANSKYNGKAGVKDISGTSADVATVKWGNGWRMPNDTEFRELLYYCNWDYVKLDDRWVVKLTSIRNGEYIYLPATGFKDGTRTDNPSGCGNYWTSTPSGTTGAGNYHYGAALGELSSSARFYGCAVRAVLNKESHLQVPISGTKSGHGWVDLALPSGTKWATCNVGTTEADQNGDYFSWGEITPLSDRASKKNDLSENENAPCIAANPRYDAATALWGEGWQTPTEEQFKELIDNCTWEWVTICGRSGYKVKSNMNQNWIFLVAAGTYGSYVADPNGLADGVDQKAAYWTSSPEQAPDRPAFDSKNVSFDHRDVSVNIVLGNRGCALSIRPVTR